MFGSNDPLMESVDTSVFNNAIKESVIKSIKELIQAGNLTLEERITDDQLNQITSDLSVSNTEISLPELRKLVRYVIANEYSRLEV